MAIELNAIGHDSKFFTFLESSKEIWEMIQKTYLKAQDASIVYEIKARFQALSKVMLLSQSTLV